MTDVMTTEVLGAGGADSPKLSLRGPIRLAILATFLLVGVLGFWSTNAVIGGAVISTGQAVVKGKPRTVQHLDGGIVEEIFVASGETVAEGQLLLRLDDTLLSTNLEIARNRLASAMALHMRLEAEQFGAETLEFEYSSWMPALRDLPALADYEAGQRQIFEVRADVKRSREAQLSEALLQIENQARGVRGQIAAIGDQLVYIDRDLENLTNLTEQGLARQSQLSELSRERAGLVGQLAGLEAELARLSNAARDAELEAAQAEHAFLENVVTELRDTAASIGELTLEIASRRAQIDRIEIRAPVSGIVHEISVNTQGAVIAPGEEILQIVPDTEALEFEVEVAPEAVDQVYPGQAAEVVFAAFDRQTTPKLSATVGSISPDVVVDPVSGIGFYRVTINVAPGELEKLGDVDLVPGMPVEAYLGTGDRTVMSYLLQPFLAHLRHAFRD